jgi:hypothetical protein
MAEDGALAAGKDRGQPLALLPESRVTDGVHAAVNAMKAADGDAVPDRTRRDTSGAQLSHGHDPVLGGGQPGDPLIQAPLGDFFRHIRNKSPTRDFIPLRVRRDG